MSKMINTAKVTKLVDERLQREKIEEIISNNTIEAEGHFVTTVIWRKPEQTVPMYSDNGGDIKYVETCWILFIDGRMDSGGVVGSVWV